MQQERTPLLNTETVNPDSRIGKVKQPQSAHAAAAPENDQVAKKMTAQDYTSYLGKLAAKLGNNDYILFLQSLAMGSADGDNMIGYLTTVLAAQRATIRAMANGKEENLPRFPLHQLLPTCATELMDTTTI
jgi:hypothetical protein